MKKAKEKQKERSKRGGEKEIRSKRQKGITLIALVITIIVLLILAAVSIATLTGENGILTKANKAKEETEKASEEEQRQLAQINAAMHDKLWYYKKGQGELTQEKGKETEGAIPIPAGFAPTQIEGEDSIEDGFVITDSEGNEFVWIPCDIDDNNESDETVNGKVNYNAKRSEEWRTYQSYYNGGKWSDGQPNENEIQNSIKNNKGFYIARYEAGVPEIAPFYASKSGDAYYATFGKVQENGKSPTESEVEGKDWIGKNTDKYIPVSKKGVPVWNFITQLNAKKVAGSMIKNNDVQSYLIDSHAWDTACRVIEKYTKENIMDSIKWGNYYGNTTTKYENLNTLYAIQINNGNSWERYAETYRKGQVTGAPKADEEKNIV